MEAFFSEAVRQFGLPVALLMAGLVMVWRHYERKDQEGRQQLLKELEETKLERNFYRDKWVEALGAAEVGEEATKRLAGGGRKRPPGGH